jgi:hypothetical protein
LRHPSPNAAAASDNLPHRAFACKGAASSSPAGAASGVLLPLNRDNDD